MRFLRIRPAVWAMISCSFSSFTLNVALGSSSVTTPGNSSISSFAIRLLPNRSSRENGRANAQNQGRWRGGPGGFRPASGICAGGDAHAGLAADAVEGTAQEAPELEHAASGRPKEQVVIEEAGIDRLLQEEPHHRSRRGRSRR